MRLKFQLLCLALLLALFAIGCSIVFSPQDEEEDSTVIHGRFVTIETTAYCPCGKCCDWRLDAKGTPIHTSGRSKGKPKTVGLTSSGRKAVPGTLAADLRHYPVDTVIYIPGYGYGCVEDTGGDIRGRRRLDLFFNTHKEAQKWGRQRLRCVVFPPTPPRMPQNAPPPY